jgi:hypothetical protein
MIWAGNRHFDLACNVIMQQGSYLLWCYPYQHWFSKVGHDLPKLVLLKAAAVLPLSDVDLPVWSHRRSFLAVQMIRNTVSHLPCVHHGNTVRAKYGHRKQSSDVCHINTDTKGSFILQVVGTMEELYHFMGTADATLDTKIPAEVEGSDGSAPVAHAEVRIPAPLYAGYLAPFFIA